MVRVTTGSPMGREVETESST